jgi:hypothetical protein
MARISTSGSQSSGSGGTVVNTVTSQVNFGFQGSTGQEGDTASVAVSASWVTINSIITCKVQATSTTDHDSDDVVVEGLIAYATDIIPGTGFTIVATAPQNTWGLYNVQAISVG